MMNEITVPNLFKGLVSILGFILLSHGSLKAQEESNSLGVLDEKIATEITAADSSVLSLQYKLADSTALDITVLPSINNQPHTPAIVFFFGGGWKEGTTDQFRPHAEYFAQRGMTGILVDYRVASRHNTTPFDAVDDAREAVEFIYRHANELGIDKNRIILAGGSAGGQLALMSSFLPKEKNAKKQTPAALVLFNPVIDTGPEGYGYERLGDRYEALSPVDNIPENPPPMIVFLGTDDQIINVEQAENFCSAVERSRGKCDLKLYRDQRHGFFNYRHTDYFVQTVCEADRFLIQQQLLKGTPNVKEWMQRRNVIAN